MYRGDRKVIPSVRERTYVVLHAYCIKETPRALWLYFYGIRKKVWIPRMTMRLESSIVKEGDRGKVALGIKFAESKQLLRHYLRDRKERHNLMRGQRMALRLHNK